MQHVSYSSFATKRLHTFPARGTFPRWQQPLRFSLHQARKHRAEQHALSALEEGSSNVTVETAVDTIKACLKGIQQRELDALMDYVPDEVIDVLLDQCKRAGTTDSCKLSFRAVLDLALTFPGLQVDTYAMRTLFMSPPANVQVLSSLLVQPDKFMQRCFVSSTTGEECIITFVLRAQETLQPEYRGVNMQQKWMLMSITGETAYEDVLDEPSPAFGPEMVVQAQLEALSLGDINRVYAFASPENKASVGGLHRFTRLLCDPPYASLLHHSKAISLKRAHAADGTYIELLSITPGPDSKGPKEPCTYVWGLRRQPNSSRLAHCWMTDSVQLLRNGSLDI